jgi:hypothetical protein
VELSFASARWIYALGVVPVLAAVATATLAPDPSGHWSDHLSGAAIDGTVAAVLVVTLVVARRRIGWTIVLAVPVVVGLAVAGWGDVTVARSIWRVPGTETRSWAATDPAAYDRGHELDESGGLIMLIGGVMLVGALALTRRIGARVVPVAIALALIPPWIAGGFGAWWATARSHVEGERTANGPPARHHQDRDPARLR